MDGASDTLWEDYDVTFQQSGNNYLFDIGGATQITSAQAGTYGVQYTVTGLPMTNFITTMNAFQTTAPLTLTALT